MGLPANVSTRFSSPPFRRSGNPDAGHLLDHLEARRPDDIVFPATIYLVQVTLGHGSITTTGRYLHARPQDGSSTFLAL
jgi:integrase/recombinase XerD